MSSGSPTDPAQLLTGTALTAFRLNGQLLEVSEKLARPAGLTAAWWQSSARWCANRCRSPGSPRAMGITRQSVQRIADLLVDKGLAEYRPNPAHARAKLLALTEDRRAAITRIGPAHRAMAEKLADHLGTAEFQRVLTALQTLTEALDVITPA
jgi:hypothetical protein